MACMAWHGKEQLHEDALSPNPAPTTFSYDDFQWISNGYYRFGQKPHHHLPSAHDQQELLLPGMSLTDQEKSP